ncbi:aminomethyl-transferring glycine dehydrogenase [Georgenia sp. Z1491]|uniref:aminomethyl-transferring glycine dehydrogenase n=1 Tax=Georgenia sp. Z1491 TaxID=3416707 RepID=UPI003CF15D79
MTRFVDRHLGVSADAREVMLSAVGARSTRELMSRALPPSIREDADALVAELSVPTAASEPEVQAELRELAAANVVRRSMIGQGYYGTHTPAVVRRTVLENPSWYTAYTPYQPEISQGRLEALLNFQTLVSDLTGLAVSGSSMLDEATAVAEGMLLARRAAKGAGPRVVVDTDLFTQTAAVLETRAEPVGIELVPADLLGGELPDLDGVAGVIVQVPGASGRIPEADVLRGVVDAAHAAGALAVAATDLLACTLMTAPGDLGFDVAVGSSQRLGVPMGLGGPHAGFLAVRAGLERQLPGRLVGVSVDADGRQAYRLALQTREQHIRRQKATSNICTAQVLLAVMASSFAVYHGPDGLTAIATHAARTADDLARRLRSVGGEVTTAGRFDTVEVRLPGRAATVAAAARDLGVLLWEQDADTLRISTDETTTPADLAAVVRAVAGRDGNDPSAADATDSADAADAGGADRAAVRAEDAPEDATGIPASMRRTTDFLTHPVFATHRSETQMLRYLKRLADKDYALDRGMIPLGSCTMKLNAAIEMESISWPGFAAIHPFAPAEDVTGYLRLVADLEGWLAELTGYAAVSLQPNAGSQGELAGLLAIRGYHRSRGDDGRTVCLVPASAHGTNAASAVLAGMSVVVVPSADDGSIDLDALTTLAQEHAADLAAIMLTYPSTHGVYEEHVRQVCDVVHEHGGQVYLDGANLNALLGHARPGELGGDVSHLNLHKTFCIPHGGGGPGVGPVAAKAHLAPFLPGHPLAQGEMRSDGAVSAAPYGSPSILPITWAYIRLMGADGLRRATEDAVLAANYVAARLGDTFPVLYRGPGDAVAHECILDLRPMRAATGITVDDVAKRLIDHGFHAPTMSFPVPGTFMVEPTESEDLGEIDRFVDAMLAIHAEATAVAEGRWPADDNPLVGAPHPAARLAGEWHHPYTRAEAAFPAGEEGKYWPPVARIDGAYGDRNLVCSCPPPEAFAQG